MSLSLLQRDERGSWLAAACLIGAIPVCGLFGFASFKHLLPIVLVAGLSATLALGLRFPLATLFVYASSGFLAYVPVFGNVKMGVPAVTGALFLLTTGYHYLSAPQSADRRSAMIPWLTMFVASCVLSSVFNFRALVSDPRGLATFVALALTTVAAMRLLTQPGTIWKVGMILAVGAVMVAALTCYQSVTGSYNTMGLFVSGDDRAYGVADPNYTAAILVTMFPLLFAAMVTSRGALKVAFAAGLALLLSAIGMTASRGGFLGMVLTGLACLFFVPTSESRGAAGTLLKRAGVGVVLAALMGGALAVSPDALWTRLSTLEDQKKVDNESRLELWSFYGKQWQESPWLGYGPGYLDPDSADGRMNIPHSTPMQFLLEVGVIGFTAYVGLSLCLLVELWSARNAFRRVHETRMAAFAGALMATFVGFHFTAFFLNRDNDKQFWLLLGVSAATVALSRRLTSYGPIRTQQAALNAAVMVR